MAFRIYGKLKTEKRFGVYNDLGQLGGKLIHAIMWMDQVTAEKARDSLNNDNPDYTFEVRPIK